RYVFCLCDKSVGNLDSQETREVVMVFTHMRGAVIPISFSKVFLPPYHRDVDIQYPRFAVFIKVFSGYWWTWISNMAQLINYGREMLRINTQKNTIEYSTD